jgi:hypothetical protein
MGAAALFRGAALAERANDRMRQRHRGGFANRSVAAASSFYL